MWWIVIFLFHDRFYDEGEENYQNNQAYPPNTYSEYTTLPPYPYYQQQPEEPYNNPYSTNPPPQNYYYNVYSTTKSPYNFENFGKQSTPGYYSPTPSTKNPYVGNYYQLIQQTTKNPYDFGNFGQTTKNPYTVNYNDNINNNYLKRSYNTASYYSDSSNVRNVTANFNNRRIIGG